MANIKTIKVGTFIIILLLLITVMYFLESYFIIKNINCANCSPCSNAFNCDCSEKYCKCDYVMDEGKTVKIKCPYNKTEENLKDSKIKDDYRYLKIEQNGVIRNKVEGYNNYVIYDPNETYKEQTLEKLDINKLLQNNGLSEYLKYYFWAYHEQSKTSFNEEDRFILVSLMLNTYAPNSSDYVKEIAKRYFGIDNFELPIGTYELPYGNYTIIKVGDYYIRSAVEENHDYVYRMETTSIELKKVERNENKITLYYDDFKGSRMMGGCYSEKFEQENKDECKIGEYKLELTYKDETDSLIVDEFNYIKR